MVVESSEVAERLAGVRHRIASAGRPPDEVEIVAVTKGFGPEAVAAAVAAGLDDCGENYAQELLAKVAAGGQGPARWHFLGPLQRNKAKALAPHVTLWQAIDRLDAGRELARRAPGAAVLVQVNLGGLPERPGCSWERAPALVDQLREMGLTVHGLMGVATDGATDRTQSRHQFRRLALLGRTLGLAKLSMGMSGDLECAVEEGATMVRVGTALFGARLGPARVRR